jgi:hypothetical protein
MASFEDVLKRSKRRDSPVSCLRKDGVSHHKKHTLVNGRMKGFKCLWAKLGGKEQSPPKAKNTGLDPSVFLLILFLTISLLIRDDNQSPGVNGIRHVVIITPDTLPPIIVFIHTKKV